MSSPQPTPTGGQHPAQDSVELAHARLTEAVGAFVDGPAWQQMLTVAARFHRYSPNNILLIGLQAPDATRVAGYRTWSQLGRQVRRGERGIAILAPVVRRPARRERAGTEPEVAAAADIDRPAAGPAAPDTPGNTGHSSRQPDGRGRSAAGPVCGFRVTHVFDISQTDGPPLPEVRPVLLDGAAPLGLWADLLDRIDAAGFTFTYADLAPANGLTDHLTRTVSLRPDLSGAQKVKTLAHELAHVLLHQPDTLPPGLDRASVEVEAESVAYIVTAAQGLAAGDYTVPYVAGWAGGDRDLIAATTDRVLSCARTILATADPPGPIDAGPDIELGLHRPALALVRDPAADHDAGLGDGFAAADGGELSLLPDDAVSERGWQR
jgi:hypothetical protein